MGLYVYSKESCSSSQASQTAFILRFGSFQAIANKQASLSSTKQHTYQGKQEGAEETSKVAVNASSLTLHVSHWHRIRRHDEKEPKAQQQQHKEQTR